MFENLIWQIASIELW